jgi:hypothetical protein
MDSLKAWHFYTARRAEPRPEIQHDGLPEGRHVGEVEFDTA